MNAIFYWIPIIICCIITIYNMVFNNIILPENHQFDSNPENHQFDSNIPDIIPLNLNVHNTIQNIIHEHYLEHYQSLKSHTTEQAPSPATTTIKNDVCIGTKLFYALKFSTVPALNIVTDLNDQQKFFILYYVTIVDELIIRILKAHMDKLIFRCIKYKDQMNDEINMELYQFENRLLIDAVNSKIFRASNLNKTIHLPVINVETQYEYKVDLSLATTPPESQLNIDKFKMQPPNMSFTVNEGKIRDDIIKGFKRDTYMNNVNERIITKYLLDIDYFCWSEQFKNKIINNNYKFI